jgi:hypothetical protein
MSRNAGATLELDLEAWRKFFGFDKNGAYGDMTIDVDLDALTMTWSVVGTVPAAPTAKPFGRDLTGRAAGASRRTGPLVIVPETATKVSIDPRR